MRNNYFEHFLVMNFSIKKALFLHYTIGCILKTIVAILDLNRILKMQ